MWYCRHLKETNRIAYLEMKKSGLAFCINGSKFMFLVIFPVRTWKSALLGKCSRYFYSSWCNKAIVFSKVGVLTIDNMACSQYKWLNIINKAPYIFNDKCILSSGVWFPQAFLTPEVPPSWKTIAFSFRDLIFAFFIFLDTAFWNFFNSIESKWLS